MTLRRLLLAVLALALVVFAAIKGRDVLKSKKTAPPRTDLEIAADRQERQTALVEVAPAPVPTSLPLRGKEGTDADGYPTQFVDAPALRSLLAHRNFAALTAAFEQFQDAFEKDPRFEYWPNDAADAFSSAEPSLRPLLDAWVQASHESFAPYLGRGTYLREVGHAQRGVKWAKDTAKADLAAMERTVTEAMSDLDRAVSLRPNLLAARRVQIGCASLTGDDERMKNLIARADESCPKCFAHRVTYLGALRPRWGGSYEAMAAYAKQAQSNDNGKLRLLAGYVDLDQAEVALSDKDKDSALAAVERACALGEYWVFLEARARVHRVRDELPQALADVNRGLELRPGATSLLFARANLELIAKQWEPAGTDLLEGLRVDPTDRVARAIYPAVLQGLIYQGWELHKAGKRDDALRVLDLAADLAPGNAEVRSRRTSIISPAPPAAPELAAMQTKAAEAPDDFRAVQQLDYGLARQNRFEEVVTLWTGFIARHPDQGRAYLERGGAYHHLGRAAEARADATKACDLGVTEACQYAK